MTVPSDKNPYLINCERVTKYPKEDEGYTLGKLKSVLVLIFGYTLQSIFLDVENWSLRLPYH
jgi:hypothetical protein